MARSINCRLDVLEAREPADQYRVFTEDELRKWVITFVAGDLHRNLSDEELDKAYHWFLRYPEGTITEEELAAVTDYEKFLSNPTIIETEE